MRGVESVRGVGGVGGVKGVTGVGRNLKPTPSLFPPPPGPSPISCLVGESEEVTAHIGEGDRRDSPLALIADQLNTWTEPKVWVKCG